VGRLLVVDDEAANNPLMRAAMTMAVPRQLEVQLATLESVDFAAAAADLVPTLVLVRDVGAAVAARARGLPDGPLNIGNVHAGIGRTQLTRSVFLNDEERAQLKQLQAGGMTLSVQAVPTESATAPL
jgi:mannose/fructose/N-acetylgalactosamine-specific phosphotransferase system component IIB